MKKKLIIGAVVGLVVLILLGGLGYFGYTLYSQLSNYKSLGNIADLEQLNKDHQDLIKQHEESEKQLSKIQKQFVIYRKQTLTDMEKRAERKVETAVASFTPLSGTYVLAAASAYEQLELCQDIQSLIQFEATYIAQPDPATLKQQEKICNSYIEQKTLPLFKYQMLRVRASMTGSLGHLRPEAEQKFKDARALMDKWGIPVNPDLERYVRF